MEPEQGNIHTLIKLHKEFLNIMNNGIVLLACNNNNNYNNDRTHLNIKSYYSK